MDAHYPTIDEPATVDYVLAVLRDEHRQQCRYDDMADSKVSLSIETTVEEWREACDLVGWRELGDGLNQIWDIACSEAEWRAVLKPARRRRLADVCELIARHATRRRIRPSRLLGRDCAPAGAFLTIRSLLREQGEDVDDLAPSTPLAELTRHHAWLFLGPISRLAPGTLPPVTIRFPRAYRSSGCGVMVGGLFVLTGTFSGFYPLTLVGVPLLAISWLLAWIAPRSILPMSVEFGELRTFRDLAAAITREPAQ